MTDQELELAVNEINTKGFTILKAVHSSKLCSDVVNDYLEYINENDKYVKQNLDSLGREKRLVNFHLISDSAIKIATNYDVMRVLDLFFKRRACVYSSLTFKYGSQQPVHRDTPHFSTWPPRLFAGVWTALENIDLSAGPLFYHPNSHYFELNPKKYLLEAIDRLPSSSQKEQLFMALDLYNGDVIRNATQLSEPVSLAMNMGDTIIWHPELAHGGSPAIDPYKSRWSIVFHCSPEEIQVYQHDQFFLNSEGKNLPARYGFRDYLTRKIALSGDVAFM